MSKRTRDSGGGEDDDDYMLGRPCVYAICAEHSRVSHHDRALHRQTAIGQKSTAYLMTSRIELTALLFRLLLLLFFFFPRFYDW